MTDYGHDLEFGVFITGAADVPARAVDLSLVAERVGIDLVTVQDHPYQPRFLDTWTLLSFVAARTTRIRLTPNVMNLPLRQPAVMARAVASLDRLSGGRVELGIGAGGFWDAVAGMGGRRLTPGQGVDALEEAIDVIRLLWDTNAGGRASYDGRYYELHGAARGPGALHDARIWIGAHKPRMLNLVGRKGDGWLPSLPYLEPGALVSGNQAIDEAAVAAGRQPAAIRRLLNISGGSSGHPAFDGPPGTWVEEMARLALEDGVSTFIVMADDAALIEGFAADVVPAVREAVTTERRREAGVERDVKPEVPSAVAAPGAGNGDDEPAPESEYARLGLTPTIDDGVRRSAKLPWDDATRPHRVPSAAEVSYTRRGRLTGKHLIDVHNVLRAELTELQDVLVQVGEGALTAADARAALHEMALRQNNWALGAFCLRYCALVTAHHGLEDASVFPHLAKADPALAPVIARLVDEHSVIHEAIEAVDHALVAHIANPDDGFGGLSSAIDYLSDALLSHLAYEELELVEPLARVGFYPSQL